MAKQEIIVADRIPPQNLDAERAVLGACMVDADAPLMAAELLSHKDFYTQQHQRIFHAIAEMAAEGQVVEPIALEDKLASRDWLQMTGGPQYLRDLLGSTPSAANLERHANMILEAAQRRRYIKDSTRVIEHAYDRAQSLEEITQAIEGRMIQATNEARKRQGFRATRSPIMQVLDRLEAREESEGEETGFIDYDYYTRGLQPGLHLVAGRPSQGKSTFAMNIIMNMAKRGRHCALALMEGTTIEFTRRSMAYTAKLPFFPIDGAKSHTDAQMAALLDAAERIAPLMEQYVHIDDSPNQTVQSISTKARLLKSTEGLDLLVVDYLNLIEVPYAGTGEERIAAISRGLKIIAKDLNIPVLAVGMINRDFTKERKGRGGVPPRPQIQHLRGSGQIEQDADTILILHPAGLGDVEDDGGGGYVKPSDMMSTPHKAYLDKNRDGRTCFAGFDLAYFRSQYRFESAAIGSDGF